MIDEIFKIKYTFLIALARQFEFPNKLEKQIVGVEEIHHYKLQINCIRS